MKKIIYLGHHEKSVTGGHKYNDEFIVFLEKISGIKIQSTPSCASKYKAWRKIFSPIIELKYLNIFSKDTLVFFGDTTFKHHFLLALLNKCKRKSQSSIIVHHFPFIGGEGLSCKINKWLMCKYVSMMDSIIVPSPYTLDVAKSLFPNKNIFYIPLPFERKFQKSSNYEKGNLLYVGSIEERKGLTYLIEALSLLKHKASFKLNVVGKVVEQKYYDNLMQLISRLGLTDNVIFWGRITTDRLEYCYRQAEIFAFPSLLEGYGIVLVEAMNNGVPIICFDNSAMPYTVKDGFNGLVAINKDIVDMASKFQLLIGNTFLRDKLQDGIEDSVKNLKTRKDFENGIEHFFIFVNK